MSTRHLVDPELLEALDTLPGFHLSTETLPELRARMAELIPPGGVHSDDRVTVQEVHVPGVPGDPDVRALLYIPRTTAMSRPAALFIHGGGYVMGIADMSDMQCRAVAEETGGVVLSVDYRVAPEVPYPGPVEDCYAALKWLHGEADRLNVDRGRIAVAGESAGGGLAAAVALMARDRGDVALAYQALVYPMIDDRVGATPTENPHVGEFLWTAEGNQFGWNAYLGGKAGSDDVPAYAAPARATDLSGLPPAYIGTGSLDLFLDEDVDYARRLLKAGVSVDLHVYAGGYHGFRANPTAGIAAAMRRDFVECLARALKPRSAAQPG